MKCPLFIMNDVRAQSGWNTFGATEECDIGECLEYGCAWWEDQSNCCSILAIAFQLGQLNKER